MPRISRKNIQSQYMHIMTQGICKEYIFEKDEYKVKYLELIENIINEYEDVTLLAYCIMGNHAHLLMHTRNIEEISKAMGRINTRYAIYYNKQEKMVGYVFRNRYYIQQILSRRQLYNTLVYIHRNPIKAGIVRKMQDYKNSSYNKFKLKNIQLEILQLLFETEEYLEFFNFIHKNFSEEEMNCIYDVEDKEEISDKMKQKKIKSIIEEFCNKNRTSLDYIKKDNKLILRLVQRVKEEINISEKQLSELIGIGKNRITNIKKKLKD